MRFQRCWIIVLWAGIFIGSGCAPSQVIDRPLGAETHAHYYAQSRTLGDEHYHATMNFDRRTGTLAIIFLDKNENPAKLLRQDRIKATLAEPDGMVRELHLSHPNKPRFRYPARRRIHERGQPRADRSVLKKNWLKELSAFKLKVWIPWHDTTYIVDYIYPSP